VGLRPDDVPQGPVEEMRGGVVAHDPRPPLGVNAGRDPIPDFEPAVKLPAMDEKPGDGLLRVINR